MNEKSGKFELMEPTSPEALVPDSWVEPWMIPVFAIVVLTLLAFLFFRKKKPAPVDPMAARKAAYAEASTALTAVHSTQARDAAVQCSLILRKYLSVAVADPALYETHEETLARHEALKEFSDEARHAAETGFTRLASMKYAADQPDIAAADVISESLALLETLHHGFRA